MCVLFVHMCIFAHACVREGETPSNKNECSLGFVCGTLDFVRSSSKNYEHVMF